MKYKILSFLLFIFISSSCFGQVTPVWQNYLGGMGAEFVYDSKQMDNGDFVVVGNSSSINAFGNEFGINTSYSGGLSDGFVARFSEVGELIWWTFYGSSGDDIIVSICEAVDGSLWIAGYSNGNVPVSSNAYRSFNTNTSTYDCFVAHFEEDGQFIGATLIGGDETDRASVVHAMDGLVYLAGFTMSAGIAVGDEIYDDQLTTSGALFIAALDDISSVQSLSYFEGNASVTGGDVGKTVLPTEDGNFIFYKGTTATEGIATSDAEFPEPFESQNGFIVKLTPTGFPIWGTYANYFSVYRNASVIDSNHFATYGMAFPGSDQSTDGAFQEAISGEGDGFITLWNQSGEMVWSTYFGNENVSFAAESITALAYGDGRIYFGGYVEGFGNLVTPSAWINNIDGIDQSRLGVFGWFSMTGSLEYCSYIVHPSTTATISSIVALDNGLFMTLMVNDFAEWTDSPNDSQQYVGETDICLIAFDLSTSTEELNMDLQLGVYPNPATDELFITGINVVGATATVYDSQGREVLKQQLQSTLDVSSLQSGYYFGTVTTGKGEVMNFRFVK